MAAKKVVKEKQGEEKTGSKKAGNRIKLTIKRRKWTKEKPQKKRNYPGEDAKSPAKKGTKEQKWANATSGDNTQAADVEMKIMAEPKKVKEQSQGTVYLPVIQEARDQAMQKEKVCVRFLNGDDACSFDRGVAPTEIRVAVAKKLDMFAPMVKLYGFSTGDLISWNMEPCAIPPILVALVEPNLVFDDRVWKEAIELHGEAADIDGVRQVLATVDSSSVEPELDGGARGIALLTELFYQKIGREMSPCLETLLEVGRLDIHREFEDGDTVLIKACCRGNGELVKRLCAAGANVHHRNMVGCTSLMGASCSGNLRITEHLLAEGSRVDDENEFGFTSLILARMHGHIDVVERLLAAGANIYISEYMPKRIYATDVK